MALFFAGLLLGFIAGSVLSLIVISLCIVAGADRKTDDVEQKRFLKEKKKMKKIIIFALALILSLLTCNYTTVKAATKPKLTLKENAVTYDGEYRRIKVTWKKLKNKTTYQIQRSKNKNFKTVDSDITLLNLKTDKDCNHGYYTKYFTNDFYVRVRAKDGKWSNIITVKGLNTLKTPVPRLEQNERTSNKRTIKLEWDNVDGASKYEVQRSIYSDFRKSEETVKSSTARTYFKISYANSVYTPAYGPASQTYYFRIRAINDDERVSKWSGVITAKGQYTIE